MDISYLSIIIFLIFTIIYYIFPAVGKLPITLEILKNNELGEYYKKNLSRLGLYFLAILVSQFALNSVYLINKCGGSAGTNVGMAAVLTFIPWTLIFAIMICVLIMYPGFKSAFADVVGYFVVAGKANEILSDLLVDVNADQAIESAQASLEQKGTLKKTAEAILKLCGNKSILINQITPENFLSVWEILKPLMKNDGKIADIDKKQKDLLSLVVTRDNVGEAIWYIYTGIFITSIVSFNLASRGCKKTIDQLKASHDDFVKQEQDVKSKQDLNNSTTMTLSS